MSAPKTTEVSPTLLWLGGVSVGLMVSAMAAGTAPLLVVVAAMAYDSPSRESSSGDVALALLLFGLAVVALSGWVFGLAFPLRRARKIMVAVGALMLLLGSAVTVTGLGIAFGGLAW